MAKIFSILFVTILGLFCVLSVNASPVSEEGNAREGRFYGMSGANAQASAHAGASGLGYGYPYGGGMGIANAQAFANAGAGAFGK